MLRLNPETMKLELGGGKVIDVNEHTVWCLFQIPKVGGDPPYMSDAEARVRRNELGEQICPSTYKRLGIRIADIVDGLKSKNSRGIWVSGHFLWLYSSLYFSQTLIVASGLRMLYILRIWTTLARLIGAKQ